MPEPSVSSIAVYQLRVVLCGVSPLVCGAFSWSAQPVSANSMKSFRMPSTGAANVYTASLYMAWPMGFRIWAASSSGKMPEACPFPVSVCVAASASAMNTTSRPIGSWTFGLSGLCPLIQNALFRHASAEGELRRRKIVLEPWIISSGWIAQKPPSHRRDAHHGRSHAADS